MSERISTIARWKAEKHVSRYVPRALRIRGQLYSLRLAVSRGEAKPRREKRGNARLSVRRSPVTRFHAYRSTRHSRATTFERFRGRSSRSPRLAPGDRRFERSIRHRRSRSLRVVSFAIARVTLFDRESRRRLGETRERANERRIYARDAADTRARRSGTRHLSHQR